MNRHVTVGLGRRTSLLTLTIVISITIEWKKKPDWSKLSKEYEAMRRESKSNHIDNSFKKKRNKMVNVAEIRI